MLRLKQQYQRRFKKVKSEKGVTLTSLIIYIIVMMIVISTVTVMTKYFYGNLDFISGETQGSKEYTSFNTLFTDEINKKNNKVLACERVDMDEGQYIYYIIFEDEHQYTYDSVSKAIYLNKALICNNITQCSFAQNDNKITVNMKIGTKPYKNVYTIESEE